MSSRWRRHMLSWASVSVALAFVLIIAGGIDFVTGILRHDRGLSTLAFLYFAGSTLCSAFSNAIMATLRRYGRPG